MTIPAPVAHAAAKYRLRFPRHTLIFPIEGAAVVYSPRLAPEVLTHIGWREVVADIRGQGTPVYLNVEYLVEEVKA